MKLHANAALSLKGRRELCRRVLEGERTLSEAAEAAEVSVRCARKWVGRYRAEGELGLLDRSSAPRSIPHRTSEQRVQAIAALKNAVAKSPWELETQRRLIQLLETRDWRADAELAQVYEAWGGHAYGRGLNGDASPEAMRDCFARIDVAVKNVDNREHDILDSDDYYQYHGGMVATVRALSGRDPAAYIGDSSDPSRVLARPLAEEARRVFRARVANPRWIASMIRHGYKGAAELAATVDYLFGYDATTGVVDDWMYAKLTESYVLDPAQREFLRECNPWALRDIAGRLLEASARGLMNICMLRPQIGDPDRLLQCGAGRDNLGENPPEMCRFQRSRIMLQHSFQHCPLAGWLMDRRTIGVLQLPNRLRDTRPLRQQVNQLQIDRIDPLTQSVEGGR